MIKKLLFIIIIISFGISKNKVGFISNVEGHVEILVSQNQSTVLNAVPGRYVYEGDVIRSYKESFCTIMFDDQTSFFTIGNYTEVRLYNNEINLKKINLVYGDIYIENKSKNIPVLIFTSINQIKSEGAIVFINSSIDGVDSIYSMHSTTNLYNKISNLNIDVPIDEKAVSYKDGIIELSNSEDNFLPANIKGTIKEVQLDLKIPSKEIASQKGDLIPAYNSERNLDIYEPLKKPPFSIVAGTAASYIDDNFYLKFSLNSSYNKKKNSINFIIDYYLKADDSPDINLWDSPEKILAKVKKINYTNSSHSIQLQAGNIEQISFGHGLIVKNFSNKYNYPFMNTFGIFFKYSNRDFISSKLFISDINDFSNNGAVIGLHNSLFISKFIPLKLGIGFVYDMNQFVDIDSDYSLEKREINSLEFDFTYDLYTKKGYDIDLISEIGAILFPDKHYYKRYDSDELGSGLKNKSGTWGGAVGFQGAYSSFLNLKTLLHYNEPLFMASFFNDTYQFERVRTLPQLDAYSDGIEQIEDMFFDYEIDNADGIVIPKDIYNLYLQNEMVYSSVGFSLDASYNYYNKILGYMYFATFFEIGNPNETNSFSSINLNLEITDKVLKNISQIKFYLSRNYTNQLFDFISDYNENTIIGVSVDTKLKKNIIFNFSFDRVNYDHDLDFNTDRLDKITMGISYNFI